MMNFKQRSEILSILCGKRTAKFFSAESEDDEAEVERMDANIDSFLSLTEYTLDEPPKRLHDHDDIGDVLTVAEWTEPNMRGVCCIPSDGCGYWATEKGFSYDHGDIFGATPGWATHVVWYNN